MIGNPSRVELGETMPNIIANTTRRSTRTSKHTSTIFETRDDISTSATSVVTKKRYAAVKSTS